MADLKQLMAMLGMANKPMGNGMVQQALQTLGGRGYQLHVQEAQAMGQQPLSQEEWAKQQQPKGLLAP